MNDLIGILQGLGSANDIVVRDGLAYVANDSWGLSVVDVSNPIAPFAIGSCNVPFDGKSLVLSGNIACVVGSKVIFENGKQKALYVCYFIDVSNPSLPVRVGKIEDFNLRFLSPALSGNYLYLIFGLEGLGIYDISDLSNITQVGSYNPPGFSLAVTVNGNYAYVGGGLQGMFILDVANPAVPVLVSTFDTPGNSSDIVLDGDLAYVADGGAIAVFDVTDKSNPVFMSQYLLPAGRGTVQLKLGINNNMMYVATATGGFLSIDITDPLNLQVKATLAPQGGSTASTFGVEVVDDIAYLANYDGGLGIVSGANGATPVQVAIFGEQFAGRGVAARPGLAIISGERYSENNTKSINSLQFVDISTPTNPVVISRIETNVYSYLGVAIAGDYAYVTCGLFGLKIFDIQDTANPFYVGGYDTFGFASFVVVSGGYAYVADGVQGLHILNIANPASPVLVGTINTPGNASNVAIVGNLAYIGDGSSLILANVESKEVPINISRYMDSVGQVKVQGNIVYATRGSDGMSVIDVSNPAVPFLRTILAPTGGPNANTKNIALLNDRAYVANHDGGVGVINIENPSAPVQIAAVAGLGNITGTTIESSSGLVLAADTVAGLIIIQP